jgi:hypothetical protein
MADPNVFGKPTDFNEEVKFYKDVYIFGKLYDPNVFGTANFYGPVNFFENVSLDTLTINKRLNVGVDGATFTAIADTGNVGIGTEKPQKTLDVAGTAIISQSLGIGSANPTAKLEVVGNTLFQGISTFTNNSDDEALEIIGSAYISKNLGIGTPNPTSDLTVSGSVLITNGVTTFTNSVDLYVLGPFLDKFSSKGALGQVLLTDTAGVFWGDVSGIGSPLQTIAIYDEGVFQGTVANLNFIDGTDPNNLVNATIGVNTSFANIAVSDRWSLSGSNIYRNSRVGINNNNPSYDLDVTGTIHATGLVEFDASLEVDGATNLKSTLNVDLTSRLRGEVTVDTGIVPDTDEGAYLGSPSLPFSESHIGEIRIANGGNDNVIDTATGNLILDSATNLVNVQANFDVDETLNVDGATTLNSTLDVDGATTLNNTLDVDGGTTLNSTLDVDGATTLNSTLDVDGATTLNNTLDVDGGTTLNSTLDVDGATTLNNTLDVDGATTLQTTLQVGIAGSVITTTGIGSVGFGTNKPRRDIEFNNKDVFFNSGAIYDTNENVGYRDELYQVPRNVLTTVGVGTAGEIISGRFFDAANLIRLNLDFIANEAVGFVTSIDYQNPAFSLTSNDYTSCKDDIKDILKSITYDITRGGNSRSVGAGLSYYNGNTLVHITGVGVSEASVAAIQKAAEISRFVINNSFYPTSYQMPAINGTYADAGRLLFRNKDFIAAEAVDRTKSAYPSLVIPGGNQNCIDDIKLILDAIIYNIQFGGNSRVYDAARFYTLNPVLAGEEDEAIFAYEAVKSIAIQVIRNETVTKNSGILNTFTQFKDLSVAPDPVSPTCQNQASAISSFVGIVTNAINTSTLPTRTEPTIPIPVPQIRDLTLQDDASRGSNTDPDGCSNVVSAITVCAGIVTTIIAGGPSAAPNITYPDGKVIWAPAGADSRNIIYVSKYGNDDNNGRTEGSAKLTIGAAAAIAEPGDTIMIRSGVYAENNPIGLRTDVTVSGQDLRLVTIYPQNNDDVFYVRRGCLVENLSFAYSKDPFDDAAPIQITGAAVAFPPPAGIGSARTGFLDPGPATEGPTGRWRSPYIRNCTNFMTGSIGMKIDGNHATASTIGADLKCMVCDSFTQYNENGIGVSITNNGYAQLVSIFTINCNIAIYADTGGSCDLTNSNSSFGNFGLVAVGLGSTEFTGKVLADTNPEVDSVGLTSVFDAFNGVRRPYDGQSLWFKINLDNYPDAVGTGTITAPMNLLSSIRVLNGGSGYSQASPPSVLVRDFDGTVAPKGPQGIIAEASATVNENGQITAIDVINTGRNYLSTQNIVIDVEGNTGLATAVMEPIYFSVFEATEPLSPTGVSTVTFNEFVPYEVFANDPIELRRISRILTSSHSFEYIGAGTDINTATPFKGGVPIKANEVVALAGAQIPFTSTDQKGNFDIGDGIQIDQTTSTIRGRDFSRAIQAEVTPLILALR